jgi:hypothetical protein
VLYLPWPDESKRKSRLRLDIEAGAKADLEGHFAIVPGEPAKKRTRPAGDCRRSVHDVTFESFPNGRLYRLID